MKPRTDREPRAAHDPGELLLAACRGDRAALGRLLSMVERGGEPAREIGRLAFPNTGAGEHVIGVTGAPGAGKSTLTDRLISTVRAGGRTVGVLAVDPSSPFSGGAILGDRIRMQGHALDDGVFIRSMATRGHLGGLALAAPEAIRLLVAAGMPVVLVETVGVGQVEVEIAGEADTTVVVVNPGWGDAIQASKAGLLEVADVFVVNKADRPGAAETRRDLETMLDMDAAMGDWRPPIVLTDASAGEGVDELWTRVTDHRAHLAASGELDRRRGDRLMGEFDRVLAWKLDRRVRSMESGETFRSVRDRLLERAIDPYEAADVLLSSLAD
ncbi:MAG TPA: methylmalonyl Co-A mutase-associated GTPase MeaB [Acidimicrobiales bacterium]|nr:methylmalonyl Co-A mutase-associated GTPase MeaB [Acidimicrobiales bacterium]